MLAVDSGDEHSIGNYFDNKCCILFLRKSKYGILYTSLFVKCPMIQFWFRSTKVKAVNLVEIRIKLATYLIRRDCSLMYYESNVLKYV